MKQLLIFSAAVAGALLGLGDAALADCNAIDKNQTCTNSTVLSGGTDGILDNGTTLTVTNTASGTISGGDGIFVNGTASVTNSGIISASGTDSRAISAFTANVTNSGTISASGTDCSGIFVFNGTANVTNSGIISASGTDSRAISAGTANVTNSGTISATGTAIIAGTANVTNSGTIISATGGSAIVATTANVTNSGTISATGAGSFGIFADAANITNFGTIKGEKAIFADGGATLVNSGSIIGTGGTAIDFNDSASDSLTFLPGSRIIGNIFLGTNDIVNIRTGHDVAWLLTFGDANGDGLVDVGASVNVSGGAPFVVNGNQIATLDPTAFGLADRSLMNVTGGISALVQNRFGGMAPVGSSAGVSSFAPAADKATEAFAGIPSLAIAYAPETPTFKAPPFAGAGITTVWTGAFGGVRHQSADGPMLGATDSAFGGALGVDRQVAPDLKLGGFVGGGTGRLAVDLNSQGVDTGYIFAGAYGRFDWASQFADFMLYGGRTSSNSSRTVANNLAPNGLETATARYDGFFISPDIAYGWRLPVGSGYVLTPTARLRYVAGFFDGFSETGSAQNLSVGSRTIQDFEQRFELDLTRTMSVGASDTLKAGLHVGAIGLERVGDTTVNTVLLGQNLAFVTPGRADAFGGLAGTSFDFASHAHISVFGAVEGIWMNDRSTTVTAKAGLRGAF
jgi:hypothetical protein